MQNFTSPQACSTWKRTVVVIAALQIVACFCGRAFTFCARGLAAQSVAATQKLRQACTIAAGEYKVRLYSILALVVPIFCCRPACLKLLHKRGSQRASLVAGWHTHALACGTLYWLEVTSCTDKGMWYLTCGPGTAKKLSA